MKSHQRKWVVWLLIGSVTGCVDSQSNSTEVRKDDAAKSSDSSEAETYRSAEADQLAKQRIKAIEAELLNKPGHLWAGEYYKGDGLGENSVLHIAPDAGYVFEWHGCLGLYDRDFGTIQEQDGRIRLSFQFQHESRGTLGIAKVLIPCDWGSRRYLISENQMVEFCNEVNLGREPRDQHHGNFFIRFVKENANALPEKGLPKFPEKYHKYLLKTPIDATITEVGQYTTEPSIIEDKFKLTPVKIDAGSRRGLLPGMKLVVTDTPRKLQTVEITQVHEDSAEGIVEQFGEESPDPTVGSKVSTKDPLYELLRAERATFRKQQ